MELERNPQPGQIWQHFKGNTYKIILCTGRKISPQDEIPGIQNCKHSETNEEVIPCLKTDLINGNDIVLSSLSGDLILEPHVIYQQYSSNVSSVSDNSQIWARPLDSFLDVISRPHINGVADYPRFTRIS